MKRLLAILLVVTMLLLVGCAEKEATKECDHKVPTVSCAEEVVCEDCGEILKEKAVHSFAEPTCEDPKTCEICGDTLGKSKGHSWEKTACGEPLVCKNCHVLGEAAGHSEDFSIEQQPATEDTDGYFKKTCCDCGDVISYEVLEWENNEDEEEEIDEQEEDVYVTVEEGKFKAMPIMITSGLRLNNDILCDYESSEDKLSYVVFGDYVAPFEYEIIGRISFMSNNEYILTDVGFGFDTIIYTETEIADSEDTQNVTEAFFKLLEPKVLSEESTPILTPHDDGSAKTYAYDTVTFTVELVDGLKMITITPTVL